MRGCCYLGNRLRTPPIFLLGSSSFLDSSSRGFALYSSGAGSSGHLVSK